MKLSRILFLLLLTGASLFSRSASAQVTITVHAICGQPNSWILVIKNGSPDFINNFRFILPSGDTSELSFDANAGDTTKVFADTTSQGGNILYYYPNNSGGILSGDSATGMEIALDSADFGSFPIHLYDSTFIIQWQVFSGNNFITSGSFTLTPTSFQSNCEFDSVSATSQTVGCDPQFNFHVFNKNGLSSTISEMKFQLLGGGAGEMRPDAMQAPPGWSVGTITPNSVTFTGGPLPLNNNLNGFIVDVSAPQNEKFFSFLWYAYDNNGDLIDRDSVNNIPATVPACSETSSSDSVSFSHQSDCSFLAHVANYHNGSGGDTVSALVEYTFKINTPGVTWTEGVAPTQASRSTWEVHGTGTDSLKIDLVPTLRQKFSGLAQPSGTIWTPTIGISGSNGQPVSISWSDSSFTNLVSSGIGSLICSNSTPDSAWLIDTANCNFSIVVSNQHSNPNGSLNAIALVVPSSAGTIGCDATTNKWSVSGQQQSVRFTNLNGASGFLHSGSRDTVSFCLDSKSANPWVSTLIVFDSANNAIDTLFLQVPGCAVPVVLDSVYHGIYQANCADTLIVFSKRASGVTIDSFQIAASGGWQVTVLPKIGWNNSPTNTEVSLVGTIESESQSGFSVTYTPGTGSTSPFGVDVTTFANGQAEKDSATITCELNGVASSEPQIPLSVSIVPNPMTSEATITLTTGAFDRVQMVLLDVLGHTIQSVANGTIAAGDHSYSLDVSQIPNGTYYLRIQTSSQTVTKALVVTH